MIFGDWIALYCTMSLEAALVSYRWPCVSRAQERPTKEIW